MRLYASEHECTVEVERDGETIEVELTIHFDVSSPEPDVGLFGFGVDEYEFTLRDGEDLSPDVAKAVEDETWIEKVCEAACEGYDPNDDFEDYYERDE
jgi:hypothetical protein